jgi:hypothetical protein
MVKAGDSVPSSPSLNRALEVYGARPAMGKATKAAADSSEAPWTVGSALDGE